MVYNTPSSVRCYEKTTIQVLRSTRAIIEDLKQKISGAGATVSDQIRVASVMEAKLYGHAFETHALRPERQAVGEAENTEWRWEIEAKEPGKQQLHLTISAVLNVNGQEGSKVLKVYDRTIDVKAALSQLVGTFVANNWQWLFGVVGAAGTVIPAWVIGRLGSHRDRRMIEKLSGCVACYPRIKPFCKARIEYRNPA